MYANHQGKYDALGIMLAHPKPCAMLWEEKSADRLVARQVCGLVEEPRFPLRIEAADRSTQDDCRACEGWKTIFDFPRGRLYG